jgi:hypothetical protein
MCRSPKLIAACHVLLRLLEPRHSLCALTSLMLIQSFRCLHPLRSQLGGCLPSNGLIFLSFVCSPYSLRSRVAASSEAAFQNLVQEIVFPFFLTLYAVVKERFGSNSSFDTSCRSLIFGQWFVWCLVTSDLREIVGPAGLEPATPALSRRCSNQLS